MSFGLDAAVNISAWAKVIKWVVIIGTIIILGSIVAVQRTYISAVDKEMKNLRGQLTKAEKTLQQTQLNLSLLQRDAFEQCAGLREYYENRPVPPPVYDDDASGVRSAPTTESTNSGSSTSPGRDNTPPEQNTGKGWFDWISKIKPW